MSYEKPFGDETGEGWKTIVAETHEKLRYLDPGYRIDQIKEKFGDLRYYFSPSKGLTWGDPMVQIMYDIVLAAEVRCARTCEYCGKRGELRQGSWWRTLCDDCAAPSDEPVGEPLELDGFLQHLDEQINANIGTTLPLGDYEAGCAAGRAAALARVENEIIQRLKVVERIDSAGDSASSPK